MLEWSQKKPGNNLVDFSNRMNTHGSGKKHKNGTNAQDTRVAGLPFCSHFPAD